MEELQHDIKLLIEQRNLLQLHLNEIVDKIREKRQELQKTCLHKHVKIQHDYDGHKFNITNICTQCHKSL